MRITGLFAGILAIIALIAIPVGIVVGVLGLKNGNTTTMAIGGATFVVGLLYTLVAATKGKTAEV